MIPILIIPHYNRFDLLVRLVDSIDFPVARLLVIDNNVLENLDHQIQVNLLMRRNQNIKSIDVYSPHRNLGVSGSWNFGIQSNPQAPYWMFSNNDFQFAPGQLALGHTMFSQYDRSVICLYAFGVFILTQKGFHQLGFFDENFYPFYFEDIDYCLRARQLVSNMEGIIFCEKLNIFHGDDGINGTTTLRADPGFKDRYPKFYEKNQEYLMKKWKLEDWQKWKEVQLEPMPNIKHWSLTEERLQQPYFLRTAG